MVELTGLMREQPTALGGDQLKTWPNGIRVRRERPLGEHASRRTGGTALAASAEVSQWSRCLPA
jgi:hypothetical protein